MAHDDDLLPQRQGVPELHMTTTAGCGRARWLGEAHNDIGGSEILDVLRGEPLANIDRERIVVSTGPLMATKQPATCDRNAVPLKIRLTFEEFVGARESRGEVDLHDAIACNACS